MTRLMRIVRSFVKFASLNAEILVCIPLHGLVY